MNKSTKNAIFNISGELDNLRKNPRRRIIVIILSFLFAFLTIYVGKYAFDKMSSGEGQQFIIGILLLILGIACLVLFLEYTVLQISNFFFGIRSIGKGINTKLGIVCIIFNLIYFASVVFGFLYFVK